MTASIAVAIIIIFFFLAVILISVSSPQDHSRRIIDRYVREEFWGYCRSVLSIRYGRRDANFCDNCSGYRKCCEEAEAELIRKGLLEPRKDKSK